MRDGVGASAVCDSLMTLLEVTYTMGIQWPARHPLLLILTFHPPVFFPFLLFRPLYPAAAARPDAVAL